MPDLIIPYEGGKVVVSEEAQHAAKAAQEWAALDSTLTNGLKRGVNNLDQESQIALNELERQMRATKPKPATVINLHPWPLTFGANSRFLRGITIPACHPGMPYAHHHIRGWRRDWEYNENGSLKFKPVLPIHLAAEFVREFSSKEAYGGGVIIYEGEAHPDKADLVETYDPIGRPITEKKKDIEYDEENNAHQVWADVPIKRKLVELIAEQRESRNKTYLTRVQKADHDYKLPDGRGKWLINDTHLLMAEMLFAEHIIAAKPSWNLASRLEEGLSENVCPACGGSPKQGAFKCSACGHILSAFKAYEAGAIEFEHVSMQTLSSDELEMAEVLKAERDQAKKEARNKRLEAARKAGEKKSD